MKAVWFQSSPPANEPVALADAKVHARVYTDSDDDEITAFIVGSRAMTEKATRRQLVSAEWQLVLPCFPVLGFELPRPPLVSVDSIAYYDLDNALQTLSTDVYQTVTAGHYGSVHLKFGQSWPDTYSRPDAVTVTYTAGYGDADAVPQVLKQGIMMRVAHWYRNKESTVEATMMQVPDGPNRIDGMFKAIGSPRIL